MADTCDDKMAAGFVKQCGYRPKQGIKRKWYVNYDDIDRDATQLANKGTKVTLLVLKSGKKIYAAEGNNKTSKGKHALSVLDFGNGYVHTDSFTILYHGENERERVQELADGARVVTIVEKVDGGINGELTYEIFGYESGMSIIEDNYDSSANSGAVAITVATEKGEEEATGKKLFLLAGGATATGTYLNTNTYVPPPPVEP